MKEELFLLAAIIHFLSLIGKEKISPFHNFYFIFFIIQAYPPQNYYRSQQQFQQQQQQQQQQRMTHQQYYNQQSQQPPQWNSAPSHSQQYNPSYQSYNMPPNNNTTHSNQYYMRPIQHPSNTGNMPQSPYHGHVNGHYMDPRSMNNHYYTNKPVLTHTLQTLGNYLLYLYMPQRLSTGIIFHFSTLNFI